MNRELLNKYKKNKRDIENLDGIIAKLQERLDAVPVVSGKVTNDMSEEEEEKDENQDSDDFKSGKTFDSGNKK